MLVSVVPRHASRGESHSLCMASNSNVASCTRACRVPQHNRPSSDTQYGSLSLTLASKLKLKLAMGVAIYKSASLKKLSDRSYPMKLADELCNSLGIKVAGDKSYPMIVN